MKYLSLFLCFKYLRSRKIVLLSIAAVAMCCALLIVVASLFTGFIEAVETSASDNIGDVVVGMRDSVKIPRYDEFIAELEESSAIEAGTGVLSGEGLLLIGKGNVRAVRLWGIEAERRARVTAFGEALLRQKDSQGQVQFAMGDLSAKSGGFVGIGVVAKADERTDEYDFARVKEEYIGRKVMLTTGTREFERKVIKFTITDVVFTGIYFFDENFVYLPIESLSEKLYPSQGKVADTIHIKLADGVRPETGAAIVRGIWRKFAEKKLDWNNYLISRASIETSRQLQSRLVKELRKQMKMLFLIFGVVSGGVVLLVFCIFYLIVMTRQKDIAIIKSCGLGSATVAALFVAFGMITGLAGSALGVVLGYFFTKNVNHVERWINIVFGLKLWKSSTYMFTRIPNQMSWESAVWVVAAAVLAAGIGALIPALTAAMVKPLQILRYE